MVYFVYNKNILAVDFQTNSRVWFRPSTEIRSSHHMLHP